MQSSRKKRTISYSKMENMLRVWCKVGFLGLDLDLDLDFGTFAPLH